MTDDAEDTRVAGGARWYRVGPRGLSAEAAGFARTAGDELREAIARVSSGLPLAVRVLESGTVRTELGAEQAARIASLLVPVVGVLEPGAQVPELEARPGGEIDFEDVDPTWYVVVPGVDYGPGLRAAFAARAALRDVLRACLPGGPLAVLPKSEMDGRGVVRLDLTPASADRLAALLSYVGDLLERGYGCRS